LTNRVRLGCPSDFAETSTSKFSSPVSPEVSKRDRRKLGVSHGVLDRSMAEPILNGPRVAAGIGQGVAAGVPEHVGMDGKGEASARTDALDEPIRRAR
jgi:hypothetical protein